MSKKDESEMTQEEEEVHIKKVRIMGFIAGAIVAAVFYIGIPYGMIHYVEPNFDTYMEGEYMYCTLRDAVLEKSN